MTPEDHYRPLIERLLDMGTLRREQSNFVVEMARRVDTGWWLTPKQCEQLDAIINEKL